VTEYFVCLIVCNVFYHSFFCLPEIPLSHFKNLSWLSLGNVLECLLTEDLDLGETYIWPLTERLSFWHCIAVTRNDSTLAKSVIIEVS